MRRPHSAKRCALLMLGALAFGACDSSQPAAAAADDSALATLADDNADPNVVEIQLEAKETMKTYGASPPTKVWSYNGSIPAPLIDVKRGDKLIVHFRNSLPEPTTIHWHGVRLPAAMDGSMAMQKPIQPGATFDYVFTLKDAGLFWFHPHVRSDIQVNKGLYGVLRVRGSGNEEPRADDEKILVLDDIKIKPDGTIPDFLDDTSRMMGRGGETILVNGKTDATLRVRPGAAVRLRIVNTANGRFFNLALPGTKFRVIGTDGGLIPKPFETEHLLVGPGERYDVFVRIPGEAGASIDLISDAYERGHHSGEEPPVKVARVLIEGARVDSLVAMPESQPALERLPSPSPTATFPIVLDEKSLATGEVVFTINDKTFPDIPMLPVQNGAIAAFEVTNASEMDHPFHLHGFFFRIIGRNGVPVLDDPLGNKDTVIVPMKSSLKLVARFDEPGMWMYHCHILEHGENGMMGEVHVQ